MSFYFCRTDDCSDSRTENLQIKFIHKAVITFLSKVVLRLLNQKLHILEIRSYYQKFIKLEVDINNHVY